MEKQSFAVAGAKSIQRLNADFSAGSDQVQLVAFSGAKLRKLQPALGEIPYERYQVVYVKLDTVKIGETRLGSLIPRITTPEKKGGDFKADLLRPSF